QQSQQDHLIEALEAIADDCVEDVRDSLKRDLYSQHDYSQVNLANEIPQLYSQDLGLARYKKAMASSAALRRQFSGLIQSDQQTADTKSRYGKLGKNPSRVLQGETKLFVRRGIKQDTGAAIHLLVDISSSMSARQRDGEQLLIDTAVEAAATMFAALEPLPNTSVGLSYFCEDYSKAIRHNERLAKSKTMLGVKPGGTTNTGGAILNTICELLACKQEKKILFVLTDGQPDNVKHLLDAINIAKKYGIIVYGIGIKLPDVKIYFENAVVINQPQDLKKELLKLARSSL
ncbi:VWA domain-containing protein, partial [Thiopseudomonas alkaliphila]|uniref:VWA domain-containing protein n=1 Tax=Thiopseudomonas alkaliphila TaxID=1697053 RepID=UPI0025752091